MRGSVDVEQTIVPILAPRPNTTDPHSDCGKWFSPWSAFLWPFDETESQPPEFPPATGRQRAGNSLTRPCNKRLRPARGSGGQGVKASPVLSMRIGVRGRRPLLSDARPRRLPPDLRTI